MPYMPWQRFAAGMPTVSALGGFDFGDAKLPAWGTGAGALVKPPATKVSVPPPNPNPLTPDGTAGSGLGKPGPALSELEKAIDRHAAGDTEVALSMRIGALLESGSLDGGWGVGDSGQSYGPFQIHQKGNNYAISVEDSLNPDKATAFMVGRYRAARDQVKTRYGQDIFQQDPQKAARLTAGYAEKTAMWGQNPDNPYPIDRAGWAWSQLQKRGWGSSGAGSSTATDARSQSVISAAQGYMGLSFRLGGNGDDGTIDCSGLTQQAYRRAGVNLPRTAQQQYDATQRVYASQAKAGDLVFFQGTYDAGTPITHVGIYLGNGQMMSVTNKGVTFDEVNAPYWRQRLVGFGRAAV